MIVLRIILLLVPVLAVPILIRYSSDIRANNAIALEYSKLTERIIQSRYLPLSDGLRELEACQLAMEDLDRRYQALKERQKRWLRLR